jgi:hypothetical protein
LYVFFQHLAADFLDSVLKKMKSQIQPRLLFVTRTTSVLYRAIDVICSKYKISHLILAVPAFDTFDEDGVTAYLTESSILVSGDKDLFKNLISVTKFLHAFADPDCFNFVNIGKLHVQSL